MDIQELLKRETTVEYRGLSFTLRSPNYQTAASIQRMIGKAYQPPKGKKKPDEALQQQVMTDAYVAAMEATLVQDPPFTREDIEVLFVNTGMFASPLAQAAGKMCGILTGDISEEDDIPSG